MTEVYFLLDSDVLIKFNRINVLSELLAVMRCVIAKQVYEEVVAEGKARRYPDALKIEATLSGQAEIVEVEGELLLPAGLGPGESAVLGLARSAADAVVVSDDRRFLTYLSAEGIAYLTSADVIVLLAHRAALTVDEAAGALEKLRPMIRHVAFVHAHEELASLQGH